LAVRLLLIRHGESNHGVQGQIADVRTCTGLTPRGVEQARALAERLSTPGALPDDPVLLTSPVLRVQQTAKIVAETLDHESLRTDDNLRELLPGEAEGLSSAEYRARFGRFDLIRPFAPGGESWTAFIDRVRATMHDLAERYDGQTVIAVSHAGFIVAALLILFGIPRPGTGAQFDPAHTAITEWQVVEGTWRLVRYNDAAHLDTGDH
jgi:probable phosphoglycerate mutase